MIYLYSLVNAYLLKAYLTLITKNDMVLYSERERERAISSLILSFTKDTIEICILFHLQLKYIAAKMCKKDPFQRPTAEKVITMLTEKDAKSEDGKGNALSKI